mmetsp:Transcript_23943/g.35159  ORF Transcript_23943/g.35159 Transcript_23943/m.35159 type:complete len:203 (+) Transcript_23943:148-756(+)
MSSMVFRSFKTALRCSCGGADAVVKTGWWTNHSLSMSGKLSNPSSRPTEARASRPRRMVRLGGLLGSWGRETMWVQIVDACLSTARRLDQNRQAGTGKCGMDSSGGSRNTSRQCRMRIQIPTVCAGWITSRGWQTALIKRRSSSSCSSALSHSSTSLWSKRLSPIVPACYSPTCLPMRLCRVYKGVLRGHLRVGIRITCMMI